MTCSSDATYQVLIPSAVDVRNPIDQIGLLVYHSTVVLIVPDSSEDVFWQLPTRYLLSAGYISQT